MPAVHAAVARALAQYGVDVMFGLIGDANMFMVHSFVTEQNRRYVGAVHEAGAMFMAYGYASVTGDLAVVTVTQGPALTNTITGLVEGVRGRLPMLVIAGDTPVASRNHPQDVDHRDFVLPTGAGFEQARTPGSVLDDLALAIRRAMIERRPIVLNIPSDFQFQEIVYRATPLRLAAYQPLQPDPAAVAGVVDLLAGVRRPVLLAGRGAIPARSELIRLAERLGAPVTTTLKARELFGGDPFNLGITGGLATPTAVQTLADADCLLVFGAGLNDFTTGHGSLLEGKRIIHVEANPDHLGPYDAVVAGDPAAVAGAIRRRLDARQITRSGFRSAELAERIAATAVDSTPGESAPGTVEAATALRFLNAVLPPERIVVSDGGRFMMTSLPLLRVLHPSAFVLPQNFGSIGTGMGAAIGAAYAEPRRPVVLVVGDGGFLHGGLAEFTTAVRERLDLIVVVCNDGGYGAEHIQFRDRGLDPAISLFDWPDLADVAHALGGEAVTVHGTTDLAKAAVAIEQRERPLLIDIRLDVMVDTHIQH